MLAYASLGVGEENVDGVASCHLLTHWDGLDLIHVCCMVSKDIRPHGAGWLMYADSCTYLLHTYYVLVCTTSKGGQNDNHSA